MKMGTDTSMLLCRGVKVQQEVM